jgi:hypothetical protein
LGDGRWWDEEAQRWRDGAGKWVRRLLPPHSLLERTRTTRVVLATAHRDHDPTNNEASNLAALCQRCHILHDREEHLRRRRLTYLARRVLGDLFMGPYSFEERVMSCPIRAGPNASTLQMAFHSPRYSDRAQR